VRIATLVKERWRSGMRLSVRIERLDDGERDAPATMNGSKRQRFFAALRMTRGVDSIEKVNE
jgi:hypothetical protein